jgi:hypothetical protein
MEVTVTGPPNHAEQATFVGTDAATARIARLRSRRGAAERVDIIRTEMAAADRVYAENLAAIGDRPRIVVTIADHDV